MKKGTRVIVTLDGVDNEAQYINPVGSEHHVVRLFAGAPALNGHGPYVADKGLRTVEMSAIRTQELVMPS
jgi:hypothetical protein